MALIDMEGMMCAFEDTEFKKARVIAALEAPARNCRTETLLPGGRGVTREGRGVKKGRKKKRWQRRKETTWHTTEKR